MLFKRFVILNMNNENKFILEKTLFTFSAYKTDMLEP